MADRSVGLLGGGQLGRMLLQAANLLEIKVNILDAAGSSAKQISNHSGHIDGSFKDRQAIEALAKKSDVLTVEIEHIDTVALEQVEKSHNVEIQPSWRTIRIIQDKFQQKLHLQHHGVATAESVALDAPSHEELRKASDKVGLPLMLKSKREAYDGKGNFVVKTVDDFEPALKALGANKELYAEKWADFQMELAVMVVKTKDQVLSYPTVETIHENSICKLTYAPARGISSTVNSQAQELARKAVASLEGRGVFGVEMFLLRDGRLLINEIAPRPHNSGHYTIEGCYTSQYEAHLRAILGLPLEASDLSLREPTIMLNILGGSDPDRARMIASEAKKSARLKLHLYGKGLDNAKKGRKMGHITVCASTMAEAEAKIAPVLAFTDGQRLAETPKDQPLVGVVMGSDSDLPVLSPGLELLRRLNVPYTARVTSAHRTPDHMSSYAKSMRGRGIRVCIAAAGGAAHLPGMVAANTSVPVIGVPVKPTIGDGMDSVLSILNMPKGVPVATVSVNNSINAALLASRILSSGTDATARSVQETLEAYIANSEREVLAKDERLDTIGDEAYLQSMKR